MALDVGSAVNEAWAWLLVCECAAPQVSEAIRWCGHQLLGNKKLVAASTSTRQGLHRADSASEGALRLVTIAEQASGGAYADVRAFQCAVKTAVQAYSSQPMLSGLLDEVDCWCYSIASCLEL